MEGNLKIFGNHLTCNQITVSQVSRFNGIKSVLIHKVELIEDNSNRLCFNIMISQQQDSFIGSKLKLLPHSQLICSKDTQLLLLAKRQIIRLDAISQTLVYSNIEDQKILHTSYHSILQVYFILTEKHILAVNRGGELIKKMANEYLFGSKFIFLVPMSDGYKGVPNHRDDLMLYVKGDNLYMVKTDVFNERQMIKSKGICDVDLTFQTSKIIQSPEYIEQQKFLPEISLLILWNTNQTYIYKTPKSWQQPFERLYIYNKVSRRENLSLDYAISLQQKVMAVGFQSGVIKIFELGRSKKYLLEMKGHQGACCSVYIPIVNPVYLYSASLDGTVRIWNLQDYQQIYMLQLDLLVREVSFVNENLLFVSTDEVKSKSYLCQINTNLLDPIANDNLAGHLIKMRSDKEWCISIYSNNLIEFLSLDNYQNNKNQKIQYPEQYGTIVDVFKIGVDCYAVSLQRGFSLIKFDKRQIKDENFQLKKLVYNRTMVYKKQQSDNFIELIHQKLLGTYLFNVISDWKDIPSAIKVSYVYFHKNKNLPLWEYNSHQRVQQKAAETTYCVIGTNKGQILFVDIEKRSHYSTKIHLHTESIFLIRQIAQQKQQQTKHFLSVSVDKQVLIWSLSHKEIPHAKVNITHNKQITYLQVFRNFLLIGEKEGHFSIIRLEIVDQSVKMSKSSSVGGHLRSVICGDYMKYGSNDVFLSGGEDSSIKIWKGVQKQLIFQLKLFGLITSVNFLHSKMDLIVCHNQQISFIKQKKLKSLQKADYLAQKGKNEESQYVIEQISPRQLFIREIASPYSPKRAGFKRTHTKFIPLFKNNSRTYDEQHRSLNKDTEWMREQLERKQTSILGRGPLSMTRIQSLQKVKPKRFHIHTNAEYQSQMLLPRINTKHTSMNRKAMKQIDSDFVSEIIKYKNKLLSSAGKSHL